jgi:hypothetical protein
MEAVVAKRFAGYQFAEEIVRKEGEKQVLTAVPAFIGYVSKLAPEDLGRPVLISRYADFEKRFCSSSNDEDSNPWAGNTVRPELGNYGPFLRSSLNLYFQNGGGPCFVLPVGQLDSAVLPQMVHFSRAINALGREDEITLVLPTDAILLPKDDYLQLLRDLLKSCTGKTNRFCLFDAAFSPLNLADGNSQAKEFAESLGQAALSFGAAYYPLLRLRPKYEGQAPRAEAAELGLPSAVAAAACYVTDSGNGVWKTPANFQAKGVVGLAPNISYAQMGELYEPDHGRAVNPMRIMPGKGVFVWGGRTLSSKDPEWRYVSVRRLVSFVENTLRSRTHFAVFEPNHLRTWVVLRGLCDMFLRDLWELGALAGTEKDDAYQVSIGLGESMTEEDVKAGRMVILIQLAPKRPAEFITLKIFHQVQALGTQL